jgi:hypothetical protein
MRKLLVDKGFRTRYESVERLYMPNYLRAGKVSKITVAVYLCLSNDPVLRKVFNRERMKIGCNNPVKEAEIAFEEIGHCLILSKKEVIFDDVKCSEESKQIRSELTSKCKQWWTIEFVKNTRTKWFTLSYGKSFTPMRITFGG